MSRARRRWRIAGINFDFRHMDHLLACAHGESNAEIVGVAHHDPAAMSDVVRKFRLPAERVFTNWRNCLEETKPDVVILCPATGKHAEWVERVAPFGVHVLLEKPFARNLAHADRIIAAMRKTRRQLAINWPLAWYPPHLTAHRLLREGRIGELQEVHFYDGNRGPTRDPDGEPTRRVADKKKSWFYDPTGGGSLIDYLGYGATLGTWYFNGRKPSEITTVTTQAPGVPVDEQSVSVIRYGNWLSTFHTRWGAFTDPWIHQPQPKCGFVLKGSEGNISNYDYENTVRLQTRRFLDGKVIPVDRLRRPRQNPVQYFLHCLETGSPIEGPLSVATCRIGQQIVDTAARSARLRVPQYFLKR